MKFSNISPTPLPKSCIYYCQWHQYTINVVHIRQKCSRSFNKQKNLYNRQSRVHNNLLNINVAPNVKLAINRFFSDICSTFGKFPHFSQTAVHSLTFPNFSDEWSPYQYKSIDHFHHNLCDTPYNKFKQHNSK